MDIACGCTAAATAAAAAVFALGECCSFRCAGFSSPRRSQLSILGSGSPSPVSSATTAGRYHSHRSPPHPSTTLKPASANNDRHPINPLLSIPLSLREFRWSLPPLPSAVSSAAPSTKSDAADASEGVSARSSACGHFSIATVSVDSSSWLLLPLAPPPLLSKEDRKG